MSKVKISSVLKSKFQKQLKRRNQNLKSLIYWNFIVDEVRTATTKNWGTTSLKDAL